MIIKREVSNILFESVELNGGAFTNAIMRKQLDHFFYFDHELDHISGIQATEAMSQLVQENFLSERKNGNPVFPWITALEVQFKKFLPLDKDIQIKVMPIESTAHDQKTRRFEATIGYDSTVVGAKGIFEVMPIKLERKKESASTNQSPNPCDLTRVNKKNPDNVFIGEPTLSESNKRVFPVIPVGKHRLFSDNPINIYSVIYLMEAFRQTQRYLLGEDPERQQLLKSISFLTEFSIKMNYPVNESEDIKLDIAHFNPKKIGQNITSEGKCDIMAAGEKVGNCQLKVIGLSQGLYNQSRNWSCPAAV